MKGCASTCSNSTTNAGGKVSCCKTDLCNSAAGFGLQWWLIFAPLIAIFL